MVQRHLQQHLSWRNLRLQLLRRRSSLQTQRKTVVVQTQRKTAVVAGVPVAGAPPQEAGRAGVQAGVLKSPKLRTRQLHPRQQAQLLHHQQAEEVGQEAHGVGALGEAEAQAPVGVAGDPQVDRALLSQFDLSTVQ